MEMEKKSYKSVIIHKVKKSVSLATLNIKIKLLLMVKCTMMKI